MGKSDDYIDFKAYTRYLRKVTGEPADPEALRQAILDNAVDHTEMQTAYVLLKRLAVVASAIVAFAFCTALYAYFNSSGAAAEEEVLWMDARADNHGRSVASRLYEAYRHSSEIWDKLQ